jgi:fructose/tagatose bisphosphate aldolase
MTKETVRMARPRDVTVEGEVGAIVGVEDDIFVKEGEAHLADPAMAIEFVKRTGVDVLAPAIGTAHGLYKGKPRIAFDVLEKIASQVDAFIAIHGGTGLSDETFRKVIELGGAKVNISTQLKHVFRDSLEEYFQKNPGDYEPVKILAYLREKTRETVEAFLDRFGSVGKA